MKDVNRKPEDPNYDLFQLALKSTAQRLYPNYANVDWSGNEGYDKNDPRTIFSTMGCRTANGYDINGFGQLKDGRGNICPVTIIMPTLAMQSKNMVDNDFALKPYSDKSELYVDEFINLLDKKIHEAKDMLIERFEWICNQSSESAKFMYENGVMEGYIPEEGIRSALKHGTLAIGQLGLAETLQILISCDHTTDKGMELAKRIEQLFKTRCAEFKEEYKLNFGVYFTPAENLCFTAMKKFKEKYGVIKDVSDKEFFTNSMHVPVWKNMNPFEKIDIESQLTGYSSAGCITYVELHSTVKNNIEALETIVNYAMDKDIPYFAVNVPNDMCTNCGYTDEIGNECPMCKCKDIRRLRRVTGYLTGDYTTAFNEGKQQEVQLRVKHDKGTL
jgi:ribonucleoside-triphosphate reductase